MLEQLLVSFPVITGREITEDPAGAVMRVDGSPDFIVGLNGSALDIELTEVRDADDAWSYVEEASRLAWKKHESYERRGLFKFPIALIFHSDRPPLYDIQDELVALEPFKEFADVGFTEVWSVDFSDAYYQDWRRPADMFCFKPHDWFGFHRLGWWDRKPFG